MANWLRNIQGQITEFATDVLNEATEEVEDLGSELQVFKIVYFFIKKNSGGT